MSGRCVCYSPDSQTKIFKFCPHCGRQLQAHKLQPTGQASRDKLVSERLKLRRDA
jgi:hypothetical protein